MEQVAASEGHDPAHAEEGGYAEPSGAPVPAQGGPPQGYGGAYGGGDTYNAYGGQQMNPMYPMDQMVYGGHGAPQGGPGQQQMYYQQQQMMGGHGSHGGHGGHGGRGGGGYGGMGMGMGYDGGMYAGRGGGGGGGGGYGRGGGGRGGMGFVDERGMERDRERARNGVRGVRSGHMGQMSAFGGGNLVSTEVKR